jgi:C4-dicarboxylate-specific signal transduction histidine kinase
VVEVSPRVTFISQQLSVAFGALHAVAWIFWCAGIDRPRRLLGHEHVVVALAVVLAAACPAPAAIVQDQVHVYRRRFVVDARRLEKLSSRLEQEVHDRTRELSRAQDELARSELLAAVSRLAAAVAHEINNPAAIALASLGYLTEESGASRRLPDDGAQALAGATEVIARIARIARIVRQLIANGAEAAAARPDSGAEVRVGATGGSAFVEILVADNGGGMPSDACARRVEPFNASNGVRHSAGLGLAVAAGLARSKGGTRRLLETSAAGTTVAVPLPAAPRFDAECARPTRFGVPGLAEPTPARADA